MTGLEIYKRFGKMIAGMRMELGLSQEEASNRLNLPKSTYGNYERGDRKIPLPDLIALSKFYGFNIDEFIREEKELRWTNQIAFILREEFDGIIFTEEELDEIITYTKYLLSKRSESK